MHVPEIIEVKEQLAALKAQGLVSEWELPYENILTRRSAALFFVTPGSEGQAEAVWKALEPYEHFSYRTNDERKLSQLTYCVTFSKEEKEKNEAKAEKAGSQAAV